ncbi:MBL fold metallo-hydrolase [Pseudoalteromonas pernae]|uniref:MBL fold metallo-hydrolase n=1 Tax=Pseudoalteromonas pernae TaxID=3118054 RepID=UPI003242696D
MKWIMSLFVVLSLSCFSNEYKIEPVKDNVYRFNTGHYYSVFMITESAAFVTDPINSDAAQWLNAEIKRRFNVPIKYLAYSHNHIDHTQGGGFLADSTTQVIAHRYADEDLRWTDAPTRMADITFAQELKVNMGSNSVELVYHGPNNGRGSVSMRFMPANVLYIVDWIVLGRMPYQDLQGYDIHGMIRSTEEVLAMAPFDVLVGGHANMGTRDDVKYYLSYIKALYDGVRDGMLSGLSVEEIQQQLTLSEFKSLPMFAQWREANIAGVHRMLMDQSYFNFRPDIKNNKD